MTEPVKCACGETPAININPFAEELKEYIECQGCGRTGPNAENRIEATKAWNAVTIESHCSMDFGDY